MKDTGDSKNIRTLNLKWPIGRTFGLAVVNLLLIATFLEGVARLGWISSYMPKKTIGSGHPQIDMKLELLDALMEREGRIDCIFLGSSMVYRAINPDIFAEAVKRRTGRDIVCFNFGLAGVGETSSAMLGEMLVRKYRPGTLILGTSPRNLSERTGIKTANLQNNPWIRYHNGFFNIDGWLTEHSVAFRRYMGFNGLKELIAPVERRRYYEMTALGYGHSKDVMYEDVVAASRASMSWLTEGGISRVHLEGLERNMRLNNVVKVVVFEVPVHPALAAGVDKGQERYSRGLTVIEEAAGRNGVTFLRSIPRHLLPVEGWSDPYHMNQKGAGIFSKWLGEKTAGLLYDEAAGKDRGGLER